jgi:hypothetical protein
MTIVDVPINKDLIDIGITKFTKESDTIQLTFDNEKIIIFDIHPKGYLKTIENLKAAAKSEKIDRTKISKLAFSLCDQREAYFELLQNGNREAIDKEDTDLYTATKDKEEKQGQSGDATTYRTHQPVDLSDLREVSSLISDNDYAEFVIKTAKKTVRQEDALVRQIFYTALSKDTADPINLAVLAPTSEGKTYPVIEVMKFFPTEDIWYIGSMSPKTLIRQNGTIVDKNNQSIDKIVKKLQKDISILGNSITDRIQKAELREQLSNILESSKTLIDLHGKAIVFLEPPDPELWQILKPILSHDKKEIEFPFVNQNSAVGIYTKKVVVRGWPACIFCSAKDESKWPQWPEIVSRFLITSPNMVAQKYLEGNQLIAQRKGPPVLMQQSLIVSDLDIEHAKKCVLFLIHHLRRFTNNKINPSPVWIPFGSILAQILPSERGTDNRITRRIFSFLNIVTLSRWHLRSRLEYGNESLVIADLAEDLHEVLHMTQNVSGIPTYKLKFFKEILIPLFKSKLAPDTSDEKQEKIIAITSRQLCDYYKAKTGKSITTNNVNETFLREFTSSGLIDEEESIIDKRQKLYFPIVDFQDYKTQRGEDENDGNDDGNDRSKITKLSISDRMDNILQHPRLWMPKNCRNIQENWLELEIFDLIKCPVKLDKFEIYDRDNERMCICKFVKSYQKSAKLAGYFSKPIFCNYDSEIFGKIKYLDRMNTKYCDKLSTIDKMDNIFISQSRAAAINNIRYSQIVLANKISRLN